LGRAWEKGITEMGNTMIQSRHNERAANLRFFMATFWFLAVWPIGIFSGNVACSQEKKLSTKSNSSGTQQNLSQKDGESKSSKSNSKTPSRIRLFNGKDLSGLKVLEKSYFDGHGKISVQDNALVIDKGMPGSGIAIDPKVFKNLPKMNYEISFDAKRIEGDDFFCGLTFPVNDSYCTMILGGWGGGAIGLSNIDTMSAIENETSTHEDFKNNVWYHIRLKVTNEKISATLQEKKGMKPKELFSVVTNDHKFDIWWEQEPARPLGFTTWSTKSAFRNIILTPISEKKK